MKDKIARKFPWWIVVVLVLIMLEIAGAHLFSNLDLSRLHGV